MGKKEIIEVLAESGYTDLTEVKRSKRKPKEEKEKEQWIRMYERK